MKKIIVNISSKWDADTQSSMIQAAFNMGFVNLKAEQNAAEKLQEVERVHLFSSELGEKRTHILMTEQVSDDIWNEIINQEKAIYTHISNKEDELRAIGWAEKGAPLIICKTTDWKIIPFENLIARLTTLDTELVADVGESLIDADLLLHTLEKGVDGILFTPTSENDLIDLRKMIKSSFQLQIETGKIVKITPIPEADRVCVDTSSMLRAGEGMLVGNTARGFGLVHAEVFDSEFVNSRPFRVNAGDVSEYLLVPSEKSDGSMSTRTNYLSEVKAGDKVLVVNTQGATRIVSVGRVKIETRPMLLFEVKVSRTGGDIPLLITIQNAETVRMIGSDNKPVSCTDLKVGDEILVHVGPGATHFGTTIKETIIEK